jgi:excisionase family DNA binding protein
MRLTPLSSLADLLDHPERAHDLPPQVARDLLPRIIGLQVAVLARALVNGHDTDSEDRLLTVGEAAARLGQSKDWLYRHATKLPFTRRVGRQVRFSSQSLESYIRRLPR